jgi:serine-type D-Ala-D-Ala carboxypeptidase (penicillin-binding protein 5/6)
MRESRTDLWGLIVRWQRTAAYRAIVAGSIILAASVVVVRADEPLAPAPHARSAIVIDAVTGAVLYERNAHAEYAPASLTKMTTALVAVERVPLDRQIQTTHSFNVVPILIGLEPGDSLPLEALLYGLLLNSGNDAALAIAEGLGDGSQTRFVGWMNEMVDRLGLANTRFKNPHGLDQEGHVSSAYDMAIIGRALMRQPVLARIVSEERREFQGPPRWVFRTRNPLMGVYAGVDGIKTGFDDNAGLCLVATAARDGRRAIAVVMNSPNYGVETASLLDYAFQDGGWGAPSTGAWRSARPEQPMAMLRADLEGHGGSKPATLTAAAHIVRPTGTGRAP